MEFESLRPALQINPQCKSSLRSDFINANSFHISNDAARNSCFASLKSISPGGCASLSSSMDLPGNPNCGKKEVVMSIASPSPMESADVPAWRLLIANLGAGAVAGCTVEAVLYPLDTIKTRLQHMTHGGGLSALLKGSGSGMSKLYSGLIGNLAGVAPASGVFFMAYEPFKKEAKKYCPEDIAPFFAGALAGIAASIVRVPTEVVKQRMQTKEFGSAIYAVRQIGAKEGIRGLYAGYGAFLLRDLPFDAIEFFAYEALKSVYQRQVKREIHASEAAVAGAVAGGFTGFVTTPFDVLKTRLMTQGTSGTYTNIFDATNKIMATEGIGGFFKGWQARLLWISIGGCVFFTALEQSRKAFMPRRKEYEK